MTREDSGREARLDAAGPQGDARARLERSGYLALRGVGCEVVGGRALLRGRVPSFYLKQMAQALVGEVEGVDDVFNLIEVG
jgi:osmotically-inducible protein OsmY